MDLRYQSTITPQEEQPYPIEGLQWDILPESFKLSVSYARFKNNIKKDKTLLDKLSFAKESCLITNKDDDFYYF